MICNELYDGQGLGNQLWNYALLRIIAKKNNTSFSVLGRSHFKGAAFLDIDFGTQSVGGLSPEGGPAVTLPRGITTYYRERKEVLRNTTLDISRTDDDLLNIPDNTKFDGNCQSVRYLEGEREHLLEWIKIKANYPIPIVDPNACIIHIRCGDFKQIADVFLPVAYYKHAMEHMRRINPSVVFYGVTDEKEVAQALFPELTIIGSSLLSAPDKHKATHHFGGPVDVDFTLLLNAPYLIIPNSSFSWWAAYLNTSKKTVIAPKYWAAHNTSNGYWSTSDIITDGFTYLDKHGILFSPEECWDEKQAFERTHNELFVSVDGATTKRIGYFTFIFLSILSILRNQKNNAKQIVKLLRKIHRALIIRSTTFFNTTLSVTRGTYAQLCLTQKTLTLSKTYKDSVKTYDCFIFFNELDLLEMRLNILNDNVNYFVIVEATKTFTGGIKPLYYEQNKERFAAFAAKIIHIVVDDMPESFEELRKRYPHASALDKEIITDCLTSKNVPTNQVQWLREFYQKEQIKKGLLNCADNDICFISDIDEIWNPSIRIDYRMNVIFKLQQDVYTYYLNNRSNEEWYGTLITSYKNVKHTSINHLDTPTRHIYTYVRNGGWHFTNQGGADKIREKIESYGHQEFNNTEIKSQIEAKMQTNTDFVGRKFTFWTDDSTLPAYLLAHRDAYQKFFKRHE